jgi:hypothetical protein
MRFSEGEGKKEKGISREYKGRRNNRGKEERKEVEGMWGEGELGGGV